MDRKWIQTNNLRHLQDKNIKEGLKKIDLCGYIPPQVDCSTARKCVQHMGRCGRWWSGALSDRLPSWSWSRPPKTSVPEVETQIQVTQMSCAAFRHKPDSLLSFYRSIRASLTSGVKGRRMVETNCKCDNVVSYSKFTRNWNDIGIVLVFIIRELSQATCSSKPFFIKKL